MGFPAMCSHMARLDLPGHPFDAWSDDLLKAEFRYLYRRVVLGPKGGWVYVAALHAMAARLREQGYDPVAVLENGQHLGAGDVETVATGEGA